MRPLAPSPAYPEFVRIPSSVPGLRLGRMPVTNHQYSHHVNNVHTVGQGPFVLMIRPGPQRRTTQIIARSYNPHALLQDAAEGRWNIEPVCISRERLMFLQQGEVLMLSSLVLIAINSHTSPRGFDPDQPVVNLSWFHAMEYCLSEGFILPSATEKWEQAWGEVQDHPSMTGNVLEWTSSCNGLTPNVHPVLSFFTTCTLQGCRRDENQAARSMTATLEQHSTRIGFRVMEK